MSPQTVVGTAAVSRLADDFFFIAHTDYGRPRLFGSALSHGLAAALLIELHSIDRITVAGGRVRVRDTTAPQDALLHTVLERLSAEPGYSVREWLYYLADTAYERVAERMRYAGMLTTQVHRRWWRTHTVHRPTDINQAAWPFARLSQHLRQGRPLSGADRPLAGLVVHTQMSSTLLDGAGPAAYDRLRAAATGVAPPVRDLLADLDAVVGNAVLSHRTT
ncbi:GOLPH3/VPS74 family protein [Micromonospora sp. SH-82]|uniref:GOLPH3/VPS74 family protein n=1 Tax=Micromonospora sp. SH-82 TaxID=3132938 RepID=UPI003EB96EAE